MRVVRIKNAITAVEITLVILVLSMITFMGTMIYSYSKLHQARPLQNFTGYITSPISLAKDDKLIAGGTFDRTVMCQLYDFHLYLTHSETKETLLIGPETLAEAPVSYANPGKSLPIKFAVSIPSTMYPGEWTPKFEGRYMCRNGLFTAHKIQEVSTNSFIVTE